MNDKKNKIFMVEDNEIFALATSKSIEAHLDCEVKVYSSGEAMLKELHEKPDLLILDLNLSVDGSSFDGKQVLEIVKSIKSTIPVVILTSSNEIKTSLDLIKRGAVDFIQKNNNYFPNLIESISAILKLKTISNDLRDVKKHTRKKQRRIVIASLFFTAILFACMFIC
jgi:DNA-binding NtrC family response regulator